MGNYSSLMRNYLSHMRNYSSLMRKIYFPMRKDIFLIKVESSHLGNLLFLRINDSFPMQNLLLSIIKTAYALFILLRDLTAGTSSNRDICNSQLTA